MKTSHKILAWIVVIALYATAVYILEKFTDISFLLTLVVIEASSIAATIQWELMRK